MFAAPSSSTSDYKFNSIEAEIRPPPTTTASKLSQNPMTRANSDDIARFLEGTATFADVVFGFDSPSSEENFCHYDDESLSDVEENRAFWDNQENLLQATICRSSPFESKVRQATKQALKEIEKKCVCSRPVIGGCRDCLISQISIRLRDFGFDSAICKSKWKSSSQIPAGEHSYIEVVEEEKKRVRVVIELNFRGEFEMARANEEYNRLISRLPELFVGKTERLKNLIKILCCASKKCMKDKKMHLGPWRKYKYMEAKWLGGYERITTAPSSPVKQVPGSRQAKPRAYYSMLTFDLMEPSLHCGTAVKVL